MVASVLAEVRKDFRNKQVARGKFAAKQRLESSHSTLSATGFSRFSSEVAGHFSARWEQKRSFLFLCRRLRATGILLGTLPRQERGMWGQLEIGRWKKPDAFGGSGRDVSTSPFIPSVPFIGSQEVPDSEQAPPVAECERARTRCHCWQRLRAAK